MIDGTAAQAGGYGDGAGASLVERWFLRVMLGVSAVAWSALLLAELGRFRLGLLAFLLAVVVIGFGLWGVLRAPRAPAGGGGLKPALAAAGGIVLCAALFLPPYHTEMLAGDATVYLNFSRQIVRHGALEFEDPLLRGMPPASRAELFRNRMPRDRTGRYARFPGGFLIADVADPTVTAGFSPLFPVLAALGHALVSPQGALVVAPLFAILSLVGLWCAARRLGGVRAAWLAAALTAVSLPQIWFAKVPLPETLAQCFVLAGLLAWLVATARGAPRWACAAGWFLGLACFAKVDLVVLLGVFLLAAAAVRLLGRARPDDPPLLLPLFAVFGLLVAHILVHYLSFDSHYRPYLAFLLRTSPVLGLLRESVLLQAGAALAAGLLAAGGAAAYRRPAARWPRRLWGLAAAGAVVVYGVAYATANTARFDETIVWLGWYFSWPVLVLAALGLAAPGLARLGLVRRFAAPPGWVFAGLLLAVVGLQYLYHPLDDPLDPSLQIGSVRRYVPVVLPLTMLFAALTAVGLLARVPAARYRAGLTLAAGALLVGLVARPSLALVGQPLWDARLAPVARLFPARAVVLVGPDLAGTHIATSLTYLHDVDAVLVQQANPDGGVLRRAIGDWLADGRPVFMLAGWNDFSFFAPDLALAAVGATQVDLRLLETTRGRVPRAVTQMPIPLRFFRVTGTVGRDRLDVDVGTRAVDLLYNLQGFHAPEREGAGPGGAFRWTGPRASLTLPAGEAVTLVVAGTRPPGAPPAEIAVWVGNQEIERRVLEMIPRAIRLELPETDAAGPVDLEIVSTTFQQQDFDSSPDPRELGVRLFGVRVHPPAAAPEP